MTIRRMEIGPAVPPTTPHPPGVHKQVDPLFERNVLQSVSYAGERGRIIGAKQGSTGTGIPITHSEPPGKLKI